LDDSALISTYKEKKNDKKKNRWNPREREDGAAGAGMSGVAWRAAEESKKAAVGSRGKD